ncbi:MAG: hypothetical protein IH867_07425 [Chloroflexi bacterium]|nr:hypothetical protein [Chloroflexota bacterium]
MFSVTMKQGLVLVAIAMLAAFVLACGTDETPVTQNDSVGSQPGQNGSGDGSIIADSQALKITLESKGADVEIGGKSQHPRMFGLQWSELKVNGESLQIYEFAPGTSAEEASEGVSASGTSIVNPDGSVASPTWAAPPHFYLFGNSILLYNGIDAEIEALLGSVSVQFAGKDFEEASNGSGDDDVPVPATGGGSIIADIQALELALESKGADVEFVIKSQHPGMFGLHWSVLKVNGESLLIYEFAPGTSAEEASEGVSASGTSIVNPDGRSTQVTWAAPPHFYLFGNSILLYNGNDAEIGALLGSVSVQFAGNDFEEASNGSGDDDVPVPVTGGGNIIADIQALELALESKGADVEFSSKAQFPGRMFGVPPRELKVNDVSLLIYEFAPGTSAEEASERVSASGTSINYPDRVHTSVSWAAPPHFYLFGNSILLYNGNDAEIGALLGSVSVQFAGSDFVEVVEVLAPIESVQILTLESYPEQFIVQVTSRLPNQCASYSHNEVTQDGTDIKISVYNTVPVRILCIARYRLHDENIVLSSDYHRYKDKTGYRYHFEHGTKYTVLVNDHPGETFETGSAPLPSGATGY